ncbi:hypothetical protein C8A03DRAFT_38471 [Achaetomium macrosporum]|uniref:Uncharacterized protein n=1 Tax=Achaetomium macrosporum TaxID=79813 RepID=A0AAN7C1V0_9PEZI|nr:hypothetical protein C8A03DRAFT_38471 [Achaetomium macrosporum]
MQTPYEGTDCTGSSQSNKLTNADQCFKNSNSLSTPFKNFKISANGAATCAPKQPAAAPSFEDIKMGTLNACHDANNLPTGFKPFTQAVGSAMFGKGVHIVTYTGKGCTGTATVTKLTNSATCYDNANSINTPFLSFKIADTDSNPECTTPKQPDNDSDKTVTVSFFSDTGCCSDPVETVKISKFGVCHNADKPFKGTTQAVGKNLFGRNIHIRQYASRDCSDRAWAQISLSNKDLCYFGSGQYQSFMISDDDGGGSGSGSCNSATPTKKSDTTVVLKLFKETTCCTPGSSRPCLLWLFISTPTCWPLLDTQVGAPGSLVRGGFASSYIVLANRK